MGKSRVKIDFDPKKVEREILSEVSRNKGKIPIEIDCPQCGRQYEAFAGLNTCPYCGAQTTLDVKVDF